MALEAPLGADVKATSSQRWQDAGERGTEAGIHLLVALAKLFGRRAAGVVLHLVAGWYVLLHPSVRRASRDYLRRVQGRARLADVYRHVLCFARVTLDRLFMVRGDFGAFAITCHGQEHLEALRARKQGAILVVAHLGSFEVLRALSSERRFTLDILGYFGNARRINAALRRLNPSLDTNLVEIKYGDPTFIFEVEQRVSDGHLIGTMGDRVGLDGKHASVPFLGSVAAFPTGPFFLAAVLKCPVLLAFGLFSEPNRYSLYCEPFAERIELPRSGRDEVLATHVARFVGRLEHYCREAPNNWFNFYDFWSPP